MLQSKALGIQDNFSLEILEPLVMAYAEVLIVHFKFVSSLQAILNISPPDIIARTSSKCRIITVVLARPFWSIHDTLV